MSVTDDTIDALHAWATRIVGREGVNGAYLFGSLVNQGGAHFDPSSSDVDIILLLSDSLDAEKRVACLKWLREAKVELEVRLMQILKRQGDHQLCSIVPVTTVEIAAGIHKGGNSRILYSTPTVDLADLVSYPSVVAATGLSKTNATEDTRTVIQSCQAVRSKYLSVSANGSAAFAISDDLALAAPKDLLRNLALATSKPDDASDEAIYISNGVVALTDLVGDKRDTSDLRRAIFTWMGPRIGAKGVKQPISDGHYLVLYEDTFDLAADQIEAAETITFKPETEKAATSPASENEDAPVAAIPVKFVVGSKKLAGDREAVIQSIAEARANMIHNRHPAFELSFASKPELQITASTQDQDLPSRKKRAAALDQLSLIARHSERMLQGFNLILYYAAKLFPGVPERKLHPLIYASLNGWIEQCFSGEVNRGGGTDVWYIHNSPGIAFNIQHQPDKELHSTSPLGEFSDRHLSRNFVPQLVSVYLHRREYQPQLKEAESDLFWLANWDRGPH